jgi:hypothetical protein
VKQARLLPTVLAALGGAWSAPAAPPVPLAVLNVSTHPAPYAFHDDGATVTVHARTDRSRAAADDVATAVADIAIPGFAPVSMAEPLPSEPNFPRRFGIGRLTHSDAAPSVLLAGYTGGAHCCVTLRVATPVGRTMAIVTFPQFDGDFEHFPDDIDGDGVADFEIVDNRFLYAFSSYAGSVAPPRFYDIIGGRIVDVSARPGFRGAFARFTAKARKLCTDAANGDRNGACAGYVAGAARLGKFAAAFREVSAQDQAAGSDASLLPARCTVREPATGCPQDKQIHFRTFPAALRWFLKDAGYIR